MKKLRQSFFILLSTLVIAIIPMGLVSSPVYAGQQKFAMLDQVVDIANDSGGVVIDYALRADDLRQAHAKVRFSGRCDSACTLYLALPANQTCITEGAYFRFHAPSSSASSDVTVVEDFLLRNYPQWVRSWINQNGGLSPRLITMTYSYASHFMRTCA